MYAFNISSTIVVVYIANGNKLQIKVAFKSAQRQCWLKVMNMQTHKFYSNTSVAHDYSNIWNSPISWHFSDKSQFALCSIKLDLTVAQILEPRKRCTVHEWSGLKMYRGDSNYAFTCETVTVLRKKNFLHTRGHRRHPTTYETYVKETEKVMYQTWPRIHSVEQRNDWHLFVTITTSSNGIWSVSKYGEVLP